MERDYIRVGIRSHAEDLCTAQLGYRTQLDAEEAQRREIDQYRYTSLDRLVHRNALSEEGGMEEGSHFRVIVDQKASALRGFLKDTPGLLSALPNERQFPEVERRQVRAAGAREEVGEKRE